MKDLPTVSSGGDGCRFFPSEEASEEATDEIRDPRRLLLGGFALTTGQIGQAADVEILLVQVSISLYLSGHDPFLDRGRSEP